MPLLDAPSPKGVAILSDQEWEEIKLAAIAGVEYRALAIRYKLYRNGKPDTNAIRQRAWREKWPVPKRILESAKRTIRAIGHSASTARNQGNGGEGVTECNGEGQNEHVTTVTGGCLAAQSGENAAVIVSDNLLDLAKAGSLRFAKVAHRSLADMPDSLPICSPSDALTTIKGLRLMAGMDSGEGAKVAVQVQLWQSPAYRQATQADPFEVESEPASAD